MSRDFRPLLRLLLHTRAPGARDVVLYVLFAQLLAAAAEEAPPPARRPPARATPRASRVRRHESLTGRRPRG